MRKTFYQIRSEVISAQQELLSTNRAVSKLDLKKLPALIQNYFIITGALGKPILWNAEIQWEETHLSLRLGAKSWQMDTKQFLSCNPISRVMLMKLNNMPFQGIDVYHKGFGEMTGKLFGCYTLFNSLGEKINTSELITIFTEFALLNSFFLSENVRFEVINETQIKTWFKDYENTVAGTFTFDEKGLIKQFDTNERYRDIGNGKSELTPFRMKIISYSNHGSYYLPNEVAISWIVEGVEFEYFTGKIKSVDFNLKE